MRNIRLAVPDPNRTVAAGYSIPSIKLIGDKGDHRSSVPRSGLPTASWPFRSVDAVVRAARLASVRAGPLAAVLARLLCPHQQGRLLHVRQPGAPVHRCHHPPGLPDLAGHGRMRRLLFLRGGDAARLAGRPNRHAGTAPGAQPGHSLLRDAALPRRHRLGDACRAQQRHPQQHLPLGFRARPVAGAVQHLHLHRPGLRHHLLFVPVRVHAGRQRLRQGAFRPRGSLRHSRRQAGQDAVAHHPADGPAGHARRLARRHRPGLHHVRLAGDPGPAGRLPRAHHQDLELLPVPAAPRHGGGQRRAASDGDDVPALGPEVDSRPPRLYRAWRQKRGAAAHQARRLEVAGRPLCPVHPVRDDPVPVSRAAQGGADAQPVRAAELERADAA